MVASRFKIIAGIEVALFLLLCVAVWEVRPGGWPIGPLAVVLLAAVVLVRFGVMLAEFASAYYWRSPRRDHEHIGTRATLRMIVWETLAVLLMMGVLVPFSKTIVARRRGIITQACHPPVIFVHGYMSRRGVFGPMLDYLWNRGLTNLFTMHFQPRRGEMDEFARQLGAYVERVCSLTRAEQVILVGFSMGGLVARAYLERWEGARHVAKLITIGTPHHGTGIARLVLGANGREMRVGSAWLKDLNRDENIPEGAAYVSIYSAHDNLVYPQSSAEVGKARNIRLLGRGHFTLLISREVGQQVYREILDTAGAPANASAVAS